MQTPLLRDRIAAINDIVCAASVLTWDARTMMPAGGSAVRGRQIATLIRLAREMLCADETLRALEIEDARLASAPDVQHVAARRFAERFGFDFGCGRLDTAQHPFEIAFTRHDVRITTRYRDDDPATALFGTFHETGHGLYEQNIDPALTRSALATDLTSLYAMGGAGSGVHESQSRLIENHIGRSRTFWRLHFGELRRAFPGGFDGIDADAYYRRVTRAGASLIRTDADEVTYDLHIMLRVELEAALMSDDLPVADLPGAWNDGMRAALGIEVPSDTQGCLQDIHWAVGEIGSFASYTIGNVMAAQLMDAMRRHDPTIEAGLECGDYAPLAQWLRRNIWTHGRLYSRDELLARATGRALDVSPYLSYLKAKYVMQEAT